MVVRWFLFCYVRASYRFPAAVIEVIVCFIWLLGGLSWIWFSRLYSFFFSFSLVCQGGKNILIGAKGQLSSPDPGKSGICSWEVKVPEDSRIVFYFNFYEIGHCGNSYSNENRCAGCTRIELRNSSNKPPWYTFCDFKASIPEPLSTDTSTLLVNFQLEADDKESSFTAEYESWPSHDSNNFKCFFYSLLLLTELFWSGLGPTIIFYFSESFGVLNNTCTLLHLVFVLFWFSEVGGWESLLCHRGGSAVMFNTFNGFENQFIKWHITFFRQIRVICLRVIKTNSTILRTFAI